MSVNFFDLMKYARTGIASPDMTGFDKLRARAAFGGYPVRTITGVPPISFKSDGTPLTAWNIAGNGQQSGTPTPDAPIMPEFVGVRTANLFDEKYTGLEIGSTVIYQPIYVGAGTFTLASTVPQFGGAGQLFLISGNVSSGATTGTNDVYKGRVRAATAENGYVTIGYRHYNASAPDVSEYNTMLNTGTSALPYEPYGYKIPITCAGQTVPVYLGQTQTVRRVKKLVLTGEETGWTAYFTYANGYQLKLATADGNISSNESANIVCTHYKGLAGLWNQSEDTACFSADANRLRFKDVSCADLDTFKAYLASEYAAGTPVTVWYVLATPQTTIVNEPLCKIGDYADELHSTDAAVTIPTAKGANVLTVDTDLQPSEISVTWHIKAI